MRRTITGICALIALGASATLPACDCGGRVVGGTYEDGFGGDGSATGNDAFGNDSGNNDTFGNDTYGNDTYGEDTFGNDTYGDDTYGNDGLENDGNGNDTLTNDAYDPCLLCAVDEVCVNGFCLKTCGASNPTHPGCQAGEQCHIDGSTDYCLLGPVGVRGGVTAPIQESSGGGFKVRGTILPYGGSASGSGVRVEAPLKK
jgi:hypothetical protein